MSQTEGDKYTVTAEICKKTQIVRMIFRLSTAPWMKLERMMTGGEGTGSESVSGSPASASRVVVILTARCERPYPRSQLQASPARRC